MQDLHSTHGDGVPARLCPTGPGKGGSAVTVGSVSFVISRNATVANAPASNPVNFIDRRLRMNPRPHKNLKCPRCDSPNTKFCYYNNYNHAQPRHFCRSCRRYWTNGGALRNVPVGGGCRKQKHTSKESISSSSCCKPSSSYSANKSTTKSKIADDRRRLIFHPTTTSLSSSDRSDSGAFDRRRLFLMDSVTSTTETETETETDQLENLPAVADVNVDVSQSTPAAYKYNFADFNSSSEAFEIPNQMYEQQELKVDDDNSCRVFSAVEELNLGDEVSSFLDQTVEFDLPPLSGSSGGVDLVGFEWNGCFDPTVGIFDQGTDWFDGDQSYWNYE